MIKFGLLLTKIERGLHPQRLACEAEASGFDSFYLPENSHVPLIRPGTKKKIDNIRRLADFYDPYVCLAACAALTKSIVLGISVSLLTQREPLVTSNAIASLDRIANGRLVVGVAGGFIREAMENFGSPFAQRWDIVRERAVKMRALWQDAEDSSCFSNDNWMMGRLITPPQQVGGPAIRIGSNSKYVPSRVADYADGWLTSYGTYEGDPVADLKKACDSRDRDFSSVTLTMMNAPDSIEELRPLIMAGYDEIVWSVGQPGKLSSIDRLNQLADLRERLHDFG
jgi:alkanesulfonate monooxygenase SsuD/methylene tetrahydromethanopterin reductase-like flavin-dependent oxidoreductase (luciferase family)